MEDLDLGEKEPSGRKKWSAVLPKLSEISFKEIFNSLGETF